MYRFQLFSSHTLPFGIVDNFNVERVPVLPTEADSPSVVYPDAVLSLSVLFQRLETIARGHGQIPQNSRAMQIKQLPPRRSLKSSESCYRYIVKQVLGFFVIEGLDHTFSILRMA
jgi:hypothetical protein